jgi:predicted acyl esterase
VPGSQSPFDYVLGVDGPADQRVEEAKTLSIASAPLDRDVTILGEGKVSLRLQATAADADIAVRIVDEWPVGSTEFPQGYAYRMGGGWRRASHRFGNASKQLAPLVPGRWTRVDVPLWPVGYRFAKGHRIRIDIAGADVPRFMPPSSTVDVTIDLARSIVELPRQS